MEENNKMDENKTIFNRDNNISTSDEITLKRGMLKSQNENEQNQVKQIVLSNQNNKYNDDLEKVQKYKAKSDKSSDENKQQEVYGKQNDQKNPINNQNNSFNVLSLFDKPINAFDGTILDDKLINPFSFEFQNEIFFNNQSQDSQYISEFEIKEISIIYAKSIRLN